MPGLDDLIPEGWRREGGGSDAPADSSPATPAAPPAPSEPASTTTTPEAAPPASSEPGTAASATTTPEAAKPKAATPATSEPGTAKPKAATPAPGKPAAAAAAVATTTTTTATTATTATGAGGGAPPVGATRREVRRFLELFGLAGLVVAQPLLEIYGKSPDVLVNARFSPLASVAFGVVLVAIPPIVLWLVTWPTVLISTRVEATVHRAVLALLAGLFVAQLVNTTGLTVVAWILGVVALAAMAVALARWASVQSWLRYLAPAPIAFLALFVFASGASPLILGGEASAAAADVSVTKPRPVVMLLFDELPTVSLLDGKGAIDAVRYPSFAELQKQSTWFRNATAPATFTSQAVPSVLTGNIVPPAVAPIYAEHPENLFTFLGGSYRMNVAEDVTSMCPSSLCTRYGGEESGFGRTLGEASRSWFKRFLPKQESAQGTTDAPAIDEFSADHSPGRYDWFLSNLEPASGQPSLNFVHLLFPHAPWELTPNGFTYDYSQPVGAVLGSWSDDSSAAYARLRHLEQLQYTDKLLGRAIARLKETGLWDDALIIVTADHGAGFTGAEPFRGVSQANAPETLWVPLFVRGPGFTPGQVNDKPAQTLDILPTVADVVGATIPWSVEGRSALQGGGVEGDLRRVAANPTNTVAAGPDGYVHLDGAAQYPRVLSFPPMGSGGDDLARYRVGPYANLIGLPAPQKAVETSNTFFALRPPGEKVAVGDDGKLPAEVHGFLNGSPVGSWVAIALNGTIVGLVQTNGTLEFYWLLPDTRFVAGENTIDLFRVDGPATAPVLHNLAIQDLPK